MRAMVLIGYAVVLHAVEMPVFVIVPLLVCPMHVVTFQFTAVTFHCSVVLMAQGKSWEDFIALIC